MSEFPVPKSFSLSLDLRPGYGQRSVPAGASLCLLTPFFPWNKENTSSISPDPSKKGVVPEEICIERHVQTHKDNFTAPYVFYRESRVHYPAEVPGQERPGFSLAAMKRYEIALQMC